MLLHSSASASPLAESLQKCSLATNQEGPSKLYYKRACPEPSVTAMPTCLREEAAMAEDKGSLEMPYPAPSSLRPPPRKGMPYSLTWVRLPWSYL